MRMIVALALACAGCGQFDRVGAGNPCTGDTRSAIRDAEACWDLSSRRMISRDAPVDVSGGGVLNGPGLPFAKRSIRQIVAMDLSASMYAGYTNADATAEGSACGWHWTSYKGRQVRQRNGEYLWHLPGFAQLLSDGPLHGIQPSDPVYAMAFNRHTFVLGQGDTWDAFQPDEKSLTGGRFTRLPEPMKGAESVRKRLTGLAGPQKVPFTRPEMWTESRMEPVLDAASTLFESFEERDGILWILTDNIIEIAPKDADPTMLRDVKHNQRFYRRLRSSPRWQVVYAYPIHRADWLCGDTLLLYGIYYSSRERISRSEFDTLTRGPKGRLGSPRMKTSLRRYANPKSPSPGDPFKLKPEDIDVVRISFEAEVECPPAATGQARTCKAHLGIENLLNHRKIEAANILLESRLLLPAARGEGEQALRIVGCARPLCRGEVRGEVKLEKALQPRAKVVLPVSMKVPPIVTEQHTVADWWEAAGSEHFVMVGGVDARIDRLVTATAIDDSELQSIYGVKALPDIFRNPSVDTFATSVCIQMAVANPSYVVALAVLGLLVLLGLLIPVLTWALKPGWRTVVVDGIDVERIRVVRWRWTRLIVESRQCARVRMGWTGAVQLRGVPPFEFRREGQSWTFGDRSDEMGTRRRLELRSTGKRARVPAKDDHVF